MPISCVKVASGGLAVSQAPAGLGAPFIIGPTGIAVTVVPAFGLPIIDAGSGIFAPPVTPTTWNPSDSIRATFSNGNLTLTTTASNNGCARALVGRSSGKFYFEITNAANYNNDFFGLAAASVALSIPPLAANTVGIDGLSRFCIGTGTLYGGGSISGLNAGPLLAVAVDLTAKLIWFRNPPSGSWVGSSLTANPATGLNGADISGLSFPLYPFATPVLSGDFATANFGGSTFSGAVPSGFAAGWG